MRARERLIPTFDQVSSLLHLSRAFRNFETAFQASRPFRLTHPIDGRRPTVYTRPKCAQSPCAPVASLAVDTHAQGDPMPRYIVTGGPTGEAGIDIGDSRYEPGDELEATAKAVKWLVDDGYLAPAGKASAAED